MGLTKITQYTHRPNATELGLGNTHECYMLVGTDFDMSGIFPPGTDVSIHDGLSQKEYILKASNYREFRINQMGDIYRDNNVTPGDDIVISQIKKNDVCDLSITVKKHHRVVLTIKKGLAEIINIGRLKPYETELKKYEVSIYYKGQQAKLYVSFDSAKAKRADSPNKTDYYNVNVNGVEIPNGTYYLSLNEDKNILENLPKSDLNTIEFDDDKLLLMGTNVKNIKITAPLQQIYYGAPGTGKSYAIDNYTQVGGYAAIRTTFHPDSDYSTFVGAYKPTMIDGRITYSFVKQAFLKAYLLAWKKYAEKTENVDPQFLVVEEINRGNCAQIFGDLFQLLDRQDNGFSSYPIEADADLQAEIKKSFEQDEAYKISNDFDINGVVKHYVSNYGQNLTKDVLEGRVLLLPNNLYIWATMNTSDQSLFPIDSAFKRRWDWRYVKISDAQKGWMIQCGNEGCDWWTFVDAINKEIADKCESEDKKLGYFFCKPKAGEDVIDEERFVGKVLFYLWNDVFKDIETSLFKQEGETEETPTFDAFYTQNEKGETIANAEAIRQFLVNVVGEENLVADFTESNTTVSTKGNPRFVLDGNGISDNMMNTVRNMVKKYADAHPAETADGIMNVFNEVCNDNDFKITNDFILETEAMHSDRMAQKQKSEKAVELDLGGRGKLFVNRYWTRKNREVFIRKAKEMQWGIIEQVNQ